MALRIFASFLLAFSILFLPFWASVIIALGAMFYFNIFWEAIVLFFLSDLLFGTKEAGFRGIIFISSLGAAATLIIVEIIKRKLKFYPHT